MGITIVVMAQGMMGAGVGKRLHESGAEVRTLLSGRSAASAERARAAGMLPAADEKALLDGADFFLSILPPGEAESAGAAIGAGADRARQEAGLCRLQCDQPANRAARRPRSSSRPAPFLSMAGSSAARRARATARRSTPPAPRRRDRGAARLGHRLAGHRGADRRRLRPQDVLCRHHQGHHRAGLGDDARRRALRLCRGADRRIVAEPAANPELPQRQHSADVRQGLSLGRRDGGDLRFPRLQPAGCATSTRRSPSITSASPPPKRRRTPAPTTRSRCSTTSSAGADRPMWEGSWPRTSPSPQPSPHRTGRGGCR